MKTIIAIFFVSVVAFSANAGMGATNMGPMVECQLPSGEKTHIPSEICRLNGGKY